MEILINRLIHSEGAAGTKCETCTSKYMESRFTEIKERKKDTKRARTQNWDDAEWKIIGNSLDNI